MAASPVGNFCERRFLSRYETLFVLARGNKRSDDDG